MGRSQVLHGPQGHSTEASPSSPPSSHLCLPSWVSSDMAGWGADEGAQRQNQIEAAVAPLRAWQRPGHSQPQLKIDVSSAHRAIFRGASPRHGKERSDLHGQARLPTW